MSKAQIAMTDLFLAVFLFIILAAFFFIAWDTYQKRLYDTISRSEMEIYTIQITNQILRSPGVPENWEYFNKTPDAIGLADKYNSISDKKLSGLKNLNYTDIKDLMNLGSYNFYFLLKQSNNSIFEIGDYPSGQSVNLRRYVTYKNEPAIVEVSLWK